MFRLINRNRRNQVALVALSALSSLMVLYYHMNELSIRKYNYQQRTNVVIKKYKDTESCILPIAPITPEFFKKKWKPTIQDCSYEKSLVVSENVTHLRFHYIPIKPQVQEKIAFWENVPLEKRPMSVFLFGVDTTSRSHAFRSLPQSIELMTKLGFLDFHSYHSVAPSTLENFMGFLMGLTRSEVRSSCAPNWSTPFDECPLIWKTYSEQKYVTNYIEDGSNAFHWAKKSGFEKPPTDYYVDYLFQRLWKIRNISLSFGKKLEPGCTSTETLSEFILRYNMRFLQTFSKIPFFSFSWINSPFHDDIYALPSLDSKLTKLFEMISFNEDLLQNTFIIFLSDHGDRTSFFSSHPESYIERRLPPLFIRLPDRLKEKHPEIINVVKSNSEKFTTPFDIHETLLHILSLDSNHSSNGSQADRSSLFHEFPRNRTCSNTNIPPAICLCNVHFNPVGNSGRAEGKHLTNQLVNFAVTKLNLKVNESKYHKNCSKWKVDSRTPVIFHRILSRSEQLVDSVIAFKVLPGEAKFEARIQTMADKIGWVEENTLVGFSRINLYGNQSWCVGFETDDDKIMKTLCYCI